MNGGCCPPLHVDFYSLARKIKSEICLRLLCRSPPPPPTLDSASSNALEHGLTQQIHISVKEVPTTQLHKHKNKTLISSWKGGIKLISPERCNLKPPVILAFTTTAPIQTRILLFYFILSQEMSALGISFASQPFPRAN